MSSTTIEIIYEREMRALINKFKHIGLSTNGIIFGGLVRDEIIGCHYRNEFFDKGLDKDRYWDEEYSPETKGRFIIPNDMDIYFKSPSNSQSFINKVKMFISVNGGKFVIGLNNDNRNLNQLLYVDNALILQHIKLHTEIIIGKTMRFNGIKLKFTIDILTVDENLYNQDFDYRVCVDNIEPPFCNLDFLCNIFIMEKTNGKVIIRPSNSTGTPIDKMSHLSKIQTTARIMNDIVNFKTEFTRSIMSFNAESINCYRIIKMIDRPKYNWNITNLSFKVIDKNDKNDKTWMKEIMDDKCCICLEEVKNGDSNGKFKIAEITTNKNKSNYLHFSCFIDYLRKEQQNRYISPESSRIECRCPFRNQFNFSNCHKTIKY